LKEGIKMEDEGKEVSPESTPEEKQVDVKEALDKFKETHDMEDGAEVLKAMQGDDVDEYFKRQQSEREEQQKQDMKYLKEKHLKDTVEKEKKERDAREAYDAKKNIQRQETEDDIRFNKKIKTPKSMEKFNEEVERRIEDE